MGRCCPSRPSLCRSPGVSVPVEVRKVGARTNDEIVVPWGNVGYNDLDFTIGNVESLCEGVVDVEIQAVARVTTENDSSDFVGDLVVGREVRGIP